MDIALTNGAISIQAIDSMTVIRPRIQGLIPPTAETAMRNPGIQETSAKAIV